MHLNGSVRLGKVSLFEEPEVAMYDVALEGLLRGGTCPDVGHDRPPNGPDVTVPRQHGPVQDDLAGVASFQPSCDRVSRIGGLQPLDQWK